MKVSKKHIATGMLAIGLITTAGAGVSAAAGDGTGTDFNKFGAKRGGSALMSDLIGISQEEFQARVSNGEKPQDILEAAGITHEDIKTAREENMREHLAQAVADGRITQEQADARIREQEAHKTSMEATRIALENNDYEAWKTAVAGTPMADKIDAAGFAKLVEAHTLRESGDQAGAKAIMDELGLKGLKGIPHGGEKGPHKEHGPHGFDHDQDDN